MKRLERIKKILQKRNIDAFIALHPPNISYMVGFQAEDSSLVIKQDKVFLITDYRYSTEYRNLLQGGNIHIIAIEKSFSHTLKKLAKDLHIKNAAFENNTIRLSSYQKLKDIFGTQLIPTKKIIENLRIIKDEGEVCRIKQAISITLRTFQFIKKTLKPAMKETELAAEIERYIRLEGAQGASFDIIVASGPNSSFPHAKKTERKFCTNEPVLIDMGVDFKGYKSDLTRVFFLGTMSPQFKKIHSIVKTAQERAIRLIQPGIPIGVIDKAARQYIKKQGFGDCFWHSLGHGVGLEVHEQPRIAPRNKALLKEGMIFTVEPAIYLDNKFGVRIEDIVRVTAKGSEVLSCHMK